MAHNDLVEGILRDYGVARRNIAGQFQIGGEIGLRDINAAAQRDPFLRGAAELFANVAPGSGEILSAGDAARIANEPLVTGASELGVISQNPGAELGLAIGGAIPIIGGAVRGAKAASKSDDLIEGIIRDFGGNQLDLPFIGGANPKGFIKSVDRGKKRFYNASTIDFNPDGYLDPHVSNWVKEVADGAGDVPVDEITSPLVYLSEDPKQWTPMIVSRKLGKHPNEVTWSDIREHGRLNVVDADPEFDQIFNVGDYSNDGSLTNLSSQRVKFYETPLYSEGDVFTLEGRLVDLPVGPEPEDWITNDSVEISESLTGNDLVNFLKREGLELK